MSDDLQRRGLLASLAARHQALEHDALRVIDRVTARLELGRERYGGLDLSKPHDWRGELREELLDALVYDVCDQLAAEDQHNAGLHEAARAEMVGGPIDSDAPAATFLPSYPIEPLRPPVITAGAVSIMDADPALKARALDQMEQECRALTAESERDFAPERHLTPVGGPEPYEVEIDASDADEPLGVQMPDYDFEGGAG